MRKECSGEQPGTFIVFKRNYKISEDGTTFTGYIQIVRKYVEGNETVSEEMPHGQGTLSWPDGSYYQGDFVNGLAEGVGIKVMANDDIYQGDFRDDKFNGNGQYHDVKQKMKYIGSWYNGYKHGKGREEFENGSRFVGNFAFG